MTSTSVKLSSSNTTSDSIAFGIDSDSNYGYIIPGADTVTPFKTNNDIYLGKEISVSLTGTTTNSSYMCKVTYFNSDSTEIHLIGKTSVGSKPYSTACNYSWTATFTIENTEYTVNSCKIPTYAQIINYIAGVNLGFIYWSSTAQSGDAAYYGGSVIYWGYMTNSLGVIPYIVVNR